MLSTDIVKFAGDNADVYVAFQEYFNKKEKSAKDKEAINKAFFEEIDRHAGGNFEGLSLGAKMSNPTYQWSTFAVIDAVINAILPQVLLPQFGMFMDMRMVGVGDIVKFTIKPNEFYTVSKGNYRPAC